MTLALKIYPASVKPKRGSGVMILLKETGGWHHGYCSRDNGALMAANMSGTAIAWHYLLTLDELNHLTQGISGSVAPEILFLEPPSTVPKPSYHLEIFSTGRKGTRHVRRIPRVDFQIPPKPVDQTPSSVHS